MRPGNRWFIYWILLGSVLLPSVQATHPGLGNNTYVTEEYILDRNGTTIQNVNVETELINFTILDVPKNDLNVTNHTMYFEVKGTGIYRADSTGVWLVRTAIDGEILTECDYRIQTFNSGVLGGDLPIVPHHNPFCDRFEEGDGYNGGSHTITVTAYIDSGTPATLENYNVHVSIVRQDSYMIPSEINVTTAIDTFIPYLFWGLLVLFLLTRKAFVSAFIGTLMVGAQVFDPPLLPIAWGALLTMITLWLELMATGRLIPKRSDGAE